MTMYNRSLDIHLFKGVPWMVVYICEAVLILAGNAITVYIFWSIRKRLKRTSYLLINLAAADILVGIAIIIWLWDGIALMMGRKLGNLTRKTAKIVVGIALLSSILSMALISLERMFAILWPFRHRILNIWCYHIAVLIVWFLAFSNSILNVVFVHHNGNVSMSVLMISAVVIITGAYLAIWTSVRGSDRISTRSMEQDRKLAKTLFVVTALSIVTCLPFGITAAFGEFREHWYSFRVQIVVVVQQANSFLNPIVYCFKMPEFKESLNKLLCRCWRKRHSGNSNGTLRSYSGDSNGFTLRSYTENTDGVTLRSLKIVETR